MGNWKAVAAFAVMLAFVHGDDSSPWTGLYHMFEPMIDTEEEDTPSWFHKLKRCWGDPHHAKWCSKKEMCRRGSLWTTDGFIECNNGNEITAIHVNGSNTFQLKGKLNLDHIPRTVKQLRISDKSIQSVHFGKLSEKNLEVIDLRNNQIQFIDFKQLHSYKMKKLVLNQNKIKQTLHLKDLSRSNVQHLNLDGNDIKIVSCKDVSHTRLETLTLGKNPIESIDFQDIGHSKLVLDVMKSSFQSLRRIKHFNHLFQWQVAKEIYVLLERKSNKNTLFTVAFISGLVITWIMTVLTSILMVKSLKSFSKISAIWVPIISPLIWCRILGEYLHWDDVIEDDTAKPIHFSVNILLFGYCCAAMLSLFNHRWREWKFRDKVTRSKSKDTGCFRFMVTLFIPSVIALSLFGGTSNAITMTFFRSGNIWISLICAVISVMAFIVGDLVLFIRNRRMILDQNWTDIVNRETEKGAKRWFMIRYVMWSTIPMVLVHLIVDAQIMNWIVSSTLVFTLGAMRIIVDGIVVIMTRRKMKQSKSMEGGSSCIYPVHSKNHWIPSPSPSITTTNDEEEGEGECIYDESYFHKMIDDHVDEAGCVHPAVLKKYVLQVLDNDIQNGVLDQSTLYQLLDTLVTMHCDQIYFLLKGLRSNKRKCDTTIDVEPKRQNICGRRRVPRLNAGNLRLNTEKNKDGAFAKIPMRRRIAYQHRVTKNPSIRLPGVSEISEGDAEWIYDWMSVSAEVP